MFMVGETMGQHLSMIFQGPRLPKPKNVYISKIIFLKKIFFGGGAYGGGDR